MQFKEREKQMEKRNIAIILMSALIVTVLSSCGNSSQENTGATIYSGEVTAENDAKETEENDTKESEEKGSTYYERGRACLYGLDGQEIDLEAAYTNFEKALVLGKTEANYYLGVLYDWYGYPEQDYDKAKTYYEVVGEYPYAQLSLGNLYYYGQGVGLEENTEKAQELFEAVIAEGCVEGYLGRGEVARTNEDFDTALECFNKVLEGEEQIYIACALSNIASMYRNGEGVEQDSAKAIEWYEKAADLGYTSAMSNIGYMYYRGEGVDQNYAQAMEWYGKAANLGNSNAMDWVGYMYQYGLSVEQDYTKAMEWYEKAADLGSSSAMNNIASLYYNGKGVEQDYAKSMEWYEKSANLGNASAMTWVGYMYQHEQGVELNYAQAMEWYKKSANLGNDSAMNNIGFMYDNGQGVEQDYAQAMEWYEKAAALGNTSAMNNIGYRYENGLGVEKNLSKAQEWYDKAAAAQ
ncbi:MAG: tetratricopeptide/SEL1-like repeat protein [Acetatifactor sp.]|nr:tetratricopeptide/SEL1-like repeat protein [Acetatifactor sp.]